MLDGEGGPDGCRETGTWGGIFEWNIHESCARPRSPERRLHGAVRTSELPRSPGAGRRGELDRACLSGRRRVSGRERVPLLHGNGWRRCTGRRPRADALLHGPLEGSPRADGFERRARRGEVLHRRAHLGRRGHADRVAHRRGQYVRRRRARPVLARRVRARHATSDGHRGPACRRKGRSSRRRRSPDPSRTRSACLAGRRVHGRPVLRGRSGPAIRRHPDAGGERHRRRERGRHPRASIGRHRFSGRRRGKYDREWVLRSRRCVQRVGSAVGRQRRRIHARGGRHRRERTRKCDPHRPFSPLRQPHDCVGSTFTVDGQVGLRWAAW